MTGMVYGLRLGPGFIEPTWTYKRKIAYEVESCIAAATPDNGKGLTRGLPPWYLPVKAFFQ